ncbi:MAG: phenylalanine--tRNA ligase subunit alpha [Fibrella sp.]|nr:phenylalanine--tRNA ligase subunit alpha [Armatimonadota bacterium]
MTEELQRIEAEAVAAIAGATNTKSLDELDNEYLGRKAGKLTGLLRGLGALPNDQKPLFGQALNEAKERVIAVLSRKRDELKVQERTVRERAEAIDVTLPGRARPQGRMHPLSSTMADIKRVMIGLGFQFVDAPDVEDYLYNFDWLNYPPDHPAMDEQDTFYIDGTPVGVPGARLLRTHTTGSLQGRIFEQNPTPPFRYAMMGRCFRRDDIDETHSHTFHQVDGFCVDEGISLADLKGVLAEFARGMFGPDVTVRFRPDFFPFVEPGVEVAIKWGDRWLELGGAGLVHPNILSRAGIDTERYTGFAFGLGIDRMPMIRHKIDDLRLFLDSDLRFLQQF